MLGSRTRARTQATRRTFPRMPAASTPIRPSRAPTGLGTPAGPLQVQGKRCCVTAARQCISDSWAASRRTWLGVELCELGRRGTRADTPHEAPLRIRPRRHRGSVLRGHVGNLLEARGVCHASRDLHTLRGCSDLIRELRSRVLGLQLGWLREVLLQQVEEFVVVRLCDAGVAHLRRAGGPREFGVRSLETRAAQAPQSTSETSRASSPANTPSCASRRRPRAPCPPSPRPCQGHPADIGPDQRRARS